MLKAIPIAIHDKHIIRCINARLINPLEIRLLPQPMFRTKSGLVLCHWSLIIGHFVSRLQRPLRPIMLPRRPRRP
jgi:hypothetical protein